MIFSKSKSAGYMKLPLLPMFFFLLPCSLVGQETSDYIAASKEFTGQRFAVFLDRLKKRGEEKILLAPGLDSSAILYIRGRLASSTLKKRTSYDGIIVTDSLVFSTEERKLIDSFVQSFFNFKWTDKLINNSTVLTDEQVKKCVSSGAVYSPDKVFFLSPPIFLRNYSVCIFYESSANCMWSMCGGGGIHYLIYKKVNDKWVPWL